MCADNILWYFVCVCKTDERDFEMVVLGSDSEDEIANESPSIEYVAPKYNLADAQASKISDTGLIIWFQLLGAISNWEHIFDKTITYFASILDTSDVEQVVNNTDFCPIRLIGEGSMADRSADI